MSFFFSGSFTRPHRFFLRILFTVHQKVVLWRTGQPESYHPYLHRLSRTDTIRPIATTQQPTMAASFPPDWAKHLGTNDPNHGKVVSVHGGKHAGKQGIYLEATQKMHKLILENATKWVCLTRNVFVIQPLGAREPRRTVDQVTAEQEVECLLTLLARKVAQLSIDEDEVAGRLKRRVREIRQSNTANHPRRPVSPY